MLSMHFSNGFSQDMETNALFKMGTAALSRYLGSKVPLRQSFCEEQEMDGKKIILFNKKFTQK